MNDIKETGWITSLPPYLRLYALLARLDRPIGIWLLLLPTLWSIVLSSGTGQLSVRSLFIAFLFTIGAVALRAAGCVINDLWDRKFDAQVERTKTRPLASGELTPYQAVFFLGLLCITGLSILLMMNTLTIILGFTVIPLVILYPLMKRVTFWAQAVLGITFNFGVLMGWSAVTGTLGFGALFLYAAGILWTLGYDTIYAHQDKEDDALLGLKSTALKFGADSKWWVAGFYFGVWLLIALAIFSNPAASGICALGLLAIAAHLGWQLYTWDLRRADSALRVFQSNRDFGLIVLGTLLLNGF